jgi:serralysin
MYRREWEDFYGDDSQPVTWRSLDPLDIVSATPTPAPGTPGNLDGTEPYDLIPIDLVAGQTYTFDYRGVPGGLGDPFLFLLGTNFATITTDDDGGLGTSSMITYTASASGTHYLVATSFTWAVGGSQADDFGDYTINVWSPEADVPGSTDVLASIATAVEISVGTTFGNLDVELDNDYYAIEVSAGMVYAFNYSGGVSGAGDRNGEAGENLAALTLYNAAGVQLSTNFNYESATSYFAAADTTIYVRVAGSNEPNLGGTGGYTLDVTEIDPSTRDPIEAFNWDRADNIDTVLVDGVPTAYVYFAPAGENFGETEATDDFPPGTPMTTNGWTAAQQAAVMSALAQYTPITGIQYLVTTDVNQAEFRLLTTVNDDYGARFYPQDPAYGTQEGIGTFNLASGGFGADPASLLPGGFSYGVILHEFGHAHGVAHPHDTGGGSEVMLGVTAATSFGVYDLNQGVYTVMSYNDGWNTHPDGDRNYSAATRASGWSATLGAFDIAVLQARYGVHAHNTGNNVYTIADTQETSSYQTIWDTGGTDTINYVGLKDVQIDLLAATLDYTPTGGGVVSFAHGVWGGYTIAGGVVIENAAGGLGNDVLLGNATANVLTGNDGNDSLMGRAGNDTLNGGNGLDSLDGGADNDILNGGNGADRLNGGAGNDTLNGGNDDDVLDGGAGNDTLNGGNGKDTYVFNDAGTDTIVSFEKNEKIDLSGLDVSLEDVTIYGNRIVVELGADDLTIMFNTRNFSASNLIFDDAPSAAASFAGSSFHSDDPVIALLGTSSSHFVHHFLV